MKRFILLSALCGFFACTFSPPPVQAKDVGKEKYQASQPFAATTACELQVINVAVCADHFSPADAPQTDMAIVPPVTGQNTSTVVVCTMRRQVGAALKADGNLLSYNSINHTGQKDASLHIDPGLTT